MLIILGFTLMGTKCVYIGKAKYESKSCGKELIWPSRFENDDFILERSISEECIAKVAYKVTKKKCIRGDGEYCMRNVISLVPRESCTFEVFATFDDKGKERESRFKSEVDGPVRQILSAVGAKEISGPEDIVLLNHKEQGKLCSEIKNL